MCRSKASSRPHARRRFTGAAHSNGQCTMRTGAWQATSDLHARTSRYPTAPSFISWAIRFYNIEPPRGRTGPIGVPRLVQRLSANLPGAHLFRRRVGRDFLERDAAAVRLAHAERQSTAVELRM